MFYGCFQEAKMCDCLKLCSSCGSEINSCRSGEIPVCRTCQVEAVAEQKAKLQFLAEHPHDDDPQTEISQV